MFKHVGLIDIEQLSERMGMTVVAVYTPWREDPEDDESSIVNPCHFDLRPEGDIDIFCSLLSDVSWAGFPSQTAQSPKKPTDEAEKARDYLMKLPARMAKVSERMVIPPDSFVFKWVEPAVLR
jgi:hypothetical protein